MSDCCCCCATWIGVIAGLLLLLKIYSNYIKGVFKGKERLDGKTAVVTGANSGIGMETARDFASRGARVVMVCRDMKKAENVKLDIVAETKNTNIVLKHINFLSLESVRKCGNEILSEEKRIDILVNNAGAGGLGFGPTSDGLEKLMQSNYFGPFLFTNILLGKIKQSKPSRIVNVSSTAYKMGKIDLDHLKKSNRTFQLGLYADTKLANIYFSNELARKLKGTGVTSNSLHPGAVATSIVRTAHVTFRFVWNLIMNSFFKNCKEGAQTQICLSVSSELANVTGEYFTDCKIEKLKDNATDMALGKKLWDFTEEVVKLKPSEKHY